MLLLFSDGIKIIFLLLLVNAAASRRPNRHQNRYVDPDQTERHQVNQNRQPDPSDRYQSNLNRQPSNRHQSHQNRHSNPNHLQSYQNRQPNPDRHQSKPVPSGAHQSQQNRLSDQNQVQIYKSNGGQLQKVTRPNPRSQGHGNHDTFLSRLLNMKNGPVVVFLTPGSDLDLNHKSINKPKPRVVSLDDELPDINYKPTKAENDAYVLYNVLSTTQEEEDLDPEANMKFEQTKDILRTYFRARCGARDTCDQKCPPPPKKDGCQANCQKVFDQLDACPPPKKKQCGKGKTLPPDWPKQDKDIYC